MCRYIADKKLHVHTVIGQLSHEAHKQTSHDADAGAVTTVAVAVVLPLVVISDCVLSVTSSQSYSSVELPVSTSRLSERVTLSQQWLTEHKKLCYCVAASGIPINSTADTFVIY